MARLAGKIAVITGAADGIGHAIGEGMAREGAHVLLADIDDARGNAFAAELRGSGLAADYHRCDVSVEADIASLIWPALPLWSGIAVAFAVRNGAAAFTQWYAHRQQARAAAH